jgi:hypothetical protein
MIGPFRVLSPSEYAYVRLLPQFSRIEDAADEPALDKVGWLLEKRKEPGLFAGLVEKAKSWVEEKWEVELLKDGGKTGASNESSTVLYGDFGDSGTALLTGDAGHIALTWAADHAESLGIDLRGVGLVQIPHHGSRSNVSPTILNRLLGPTRPADQRKALAFVSAPKDDEKHPRKMVVNAFQRRCRGVYATQGSYIFWPRRFRDSGDAVPLPFYKKVEDYD